ncbi:MAG: malto-oligosyltrehalose trehalohydrolase [Propionibacteriaceae bacterium]|nr:malto-oligosyltrehalose trehalohydrolase [Propionibacteriaceae bacterium]
MRDITRPEVWAPEATQVELLLADGPVAMTPSGGGWWQAEPLPFGTRYQFRVDGGMPLPDPRSLSQPDGPHGASRIVDPALLTRPATFSTDLRGAVGYELHVGTFTPEGTFKAAIEHLNHLVELGVEAVEVMPVADFPGSQGWGYDGVGQYAVHQAYGGPEQFAEFIDACHTRGLGVILDVVHNHQGPEGNYLAQFGPYFTDVHHTPWGSAVNLDQPCSDEVRAFLLGACRQWLVGFQVDGLRLDAVHELQDDSPTHYLAELSSAVRDWERETGRKFTLFAESDRNQPATVSPVGSVPGALGMDGQWADDIHHALHSFFSREQHGYYVDFGSAEVLKHALTRVFIHEGGFSTFRDKPWGAPVDPASNLYDGHSFVASLQNHDQVGNRAAGDRLGHAVPPGGQAAGAALYLLSAFTPLVFMGEEWAASTPFPFFSDLGPELGPLVTQGRLAEFARMGWDAVVPDPQSSTTRESAVLRWDELRQPEHARMFDWYRTLLRLRRRHPELSDPDLSRVSVEVFEPDTVVMRRGGFAVAATRGEQLVELPLQGEVLASWDAVRPLPDGISLPGPGAAILRLAE